MSTPIARTGAASLCVPPSTTTALGPSACISAGSTVGSTSVALPTLPTDAR